MSLTLYTLKSVCIFSILLSKHFLMYQITRVDLILLRYQLVKDRY